MNTLMKTSVSLITGIFLSSSLVACAPFDAFQPEKEEEVVEPQKKLELPENLSEKLADLLILSLEANPSAVFPEQNNMEDISIQGFVNLFDLAGQTVVQGLSSQKIYTGNTRLDESGADQFEIKVQVFARRAGVNSTLEFAGVLNNMVDEKTKGFVELQLINPDDNISGYIDCLEVDVSMKEALKREDGFGIRAYAACLESTCDATVVKLQLENRSGEASDSRVGFAFEDHSSPGINKLDEPITLVRTESSLPDVKTLQQAIADRQAEDIDERCRPEIDAGETPVLPAQIEEVPADETALVSEGTLSAEDVMGETDAVEAALREAMEGSDAPTVEIVMPEIVSPAEAEAPGALETTAPDNLPTVGHEANTDVEDDAAAITETSRSVDQGLYE